MHGSLLPLLDAFAGLEVLVIGDAMLDCYLRGSSSRLCREAPVPVVSLAQREDVPGGAANTAVNLHALGARVHLLSVAGADREGQILRAALEARGIPAEDTLVQAGRQTLAKHRVIADSQILIRFDQGQSMPLDSATEGELERRLLDRFPRSAAVVVSDYGYGVLAPRLIATIARLQAGAPRVLVVDSRNLAAFRTAGVTAVKPNYAEAVALLGLQRAPTGEMRATEIVRHGDRILDLTGARVAAVTLDSDGAIIFERGAPPYRTRTQPVTHDHTTGAGDTYVSALALALAAGASSREAADVAAATAALVVARAGTTACSRADLRASFSVGRRFIPDRETLTGLVDLYRAQQKRIVFTNGCFDLLHPGHIAFLHQARALGDILIVGVNSDRSVALLKGHGRPINPLADRMRVLAGLDGIDHLVAFDDVRPDALIAAVRPAVVAKGGNYTRDEMPEAALVEALGGRIAILPLQGAHSTHNLIDRLAAFPHGMTSARVLDPGAPVSA